MEKLTSRHWALYNLLKNECLAFTVKEICDMLPNYYKLGTSNNASSSGKNTNCPTIYKDIDTINNSYEVEHIIVIDNGDIYLGSENDTKKYADKLLQRAIKQLVKYGNVCQKIKKDGQGKLVSCHNEVIDEESRARRFVESYLKGDN